MRLNQYHRCLQAVQGKSPLVVSRGYQPEPNETPAQLWTLITGCVVLVILGVVA